VLGQGKKNQIRKKGDVFYWEKGRGGRGGGGEGRPLAQSHRLGPSGRHTSEQGAATHTETDRGSKGEGETLVKFWETYRLDKKKKKTEFQHRGGRMKVPSLWEIDTRRGPSDPTCEKRKAGGKK